MIAIHSFMLEKKKRCWKGGGELVALAMRCFAKKMRGNSTLSFFYNDKKLAIDHGLNEKEEAVAA